MSLTVQYILVALIVGGSLLWMTIGILRSHKKRNKNNCNEDKSDKRDLSCSGCTLSDVCKSKR